MRKNKLHSGNFHKVVRSHKIVKSGLSYIG